MRQAIYAILGAAATTIAATSAGLLLLRLLNLRLKQEEQRVLAFFAGSAILSTLVFVLAVTGLARKGVIVAVAVILVLVARKTWAFHAGSQAEVPREQWLLLGIVLTFFGILYLVNAWAPEHSPDGVTYHLGLVARYYRAHGFEPILTNMYAHLSQGLEMLFLFAYAIGRHSAASLVHCTFLFALPLALITFARRFTGATVGLFAAVLVFASPIFGVDGASAYNDAALAGVLFAFFWTLELWRESKQLGFVILAGLLAGFAFAIKYTGGLGVLLGLAYVWRNRRASLIFLACAALIAAPWLLKNIVYTGNPLAPFANSLFPNPLYYPDQERQFRAYLQQYELGLGGLVWNVTVDGRETTGLLGPVFLLSPLALFALRQRLGRRLLAAAGLFAIPFILNTGTRFLMPSAVFLALAIGLVLRHHRRVMIGIAALHAILSAPGIVKLYAGEGAWRLTNLPIRAALRWESEDEYLSHNFPYIQARILEHYVPPDHRVFSFGTMAADAYTSRELVVAFQSAYGEALRDTFLTPLIAGMQPTRWLVFRFATLQTRAIRACQTDVNDDNWSISEFRLFQRGVELPREPTWGIKAPPNPWHVQRAFDNNPVTRWRAHDKSRPGMCVEVRLSRPAAIDTVRLESSRDQYKVRLELDALTDARGWQHINATVDDLESPQLSEYDLRRAATDEAKRLGVRWLLIDDNDFAAKDLDQFSAAWGVRPVAKRGSATLYYVE